MTLVLTYHPLKMHYFDRTNHYLQILSWEAFQKSGLCVSEYVCVYLSAHSNIKKNVSQKSRRVTKIENPSLRSEKALTEGIGRAMMIKSKQTDSCFAIIPSGASNFQRGDFYIANTNTRYFIILYWRERVRGCAGKEAPRPPRRSWTNPAWVGELKKPSNPNILWER